MANKRSTPFGVAYSAEPLVSVRVYMQPAERDIVRRLAAAAGVSMSEYFKQLVDTEVTRQLAGR